MLLAVRMFSVALCWQRTSCLYMWTKLTRTNHCRSVIFLRYSAPKAPKLLKPSRYFGPRILFHDSCWPCWFYILCFFLHCSLQLQSDSCSVISYSNTLFHLIVFNSFWHYSIVSRMTNCYRECYELLDISYQVTFQCFAVFAWAIERTCHCKTTVLYVC